MISDQYPIPLAQAFILYPRLCHTVGVDQRIDRSRLSHLRPIAGRSAQYSIDNEKLPRYSGRAHSPWVTRGGACSTPGSYAALIRTIF